MPFLNLTKSSSNQTIMANNTQPNFFAILNNSNLITDDFVESDNYTSTEEDYLDAIHEYLFPKTWIWILLAFHLIIFIAGLVGNILVCVSVYRNHSMRTVTNYFIVNLAVADFLVILFCLPPSVIWDVTSTWFFGVAMCKIVLYLQTVSVTVSVLTLTFISIDRWYAICYPLKFKSTTGRAKTAIFVIWFLALVLDIPELIVYTTKRHEAAEFDTIYFTQCGPTWSNDTDTMWTVLKMILLYVVPLGFMTITYCQIIRVLWRSGHNKFTMGMAGKTLPATVTTPAGGGSSNGKPHKNTLLLNTNSNMEMQLRSRLKAAKMLVAVVVMFAFCYFPVHLLSVLRLTVDLKNSDSNRAFAFISHLLCYANSAVNPIIYNFMSGKFRKEFRRAIDCSSTLDGAGGGGGGGGGYDMNSLYYNNTMRAAHARTRNGNGSGSTGTVAASIRYTNGSRVVQRGVGGGGGGSGVQKKLLQHQQHGGAMIEDDSEAQEFFKDRRDTTVIKIDV